MNSGWIKLHRRLLENPLIQKSAYFTLWATLLLLANHEPTCFIWNNIKQVIKEGQLLTGRDKLAKLLRISPTSVERILKYLENEHQIGQQKTTKFRIITILNWKEYQGMDSKTDNKRTTKGQQKDTYKNDKNDKNDKNNTLSQCLATKDFEDFKTYATSKGFNDRDLKEEWEKMENWLASSKRKVKCYKNFWLNWLKKTKPDERIVKQLEDEAITKKRADYEKKMEEEKCKDAKPFLENIRQNLVKKFTP
jgi:hypothetical protein